MIGRRFRVIRTNINIYMNKLHKRLKGFQKHYRNRHLLAKELNLKDEEYRLWDFMVATCGWDSRHIDTYLIVEATLGHIAGFLHWSTSKTSRVMNNLINKGIIVRKKDAGYEIKLRAERGSEEKDKEGLMEMGIDVSPLAKYFLSAKKEVLPAQRDQGYSPVPSLVSSNASLVSKEIENSLSAEDRKWIQNNVN